MSSFLSGGGVECGPTSVLKTVSGRLERDTSVRQDRMISVPNVAGSSSLPFRPVIKQPYRATPVAPTAFDLSTLKQHLSPVQSPSPSQQLHQSPSGSSIWAEGFTPQQTHRESSPVYTERTSSPWQRDFQRHMASPPPQVMGDQQHLQNHAYQSQQTSLAPWQMPYRPAYQHPPVFPQYPMQQFQPPPQQFIHPQAEQHLQHQETSEPARTTPLEPLTESQDLLAKTAQTLVNNLSPELTSSNPKLGQSKFMALMNGLSTGNVVIEDGALPVNADTVGEGAKLVDRSRGGDWASGFLDLEAGSSRQSNTSNWAQEMSSNPSQAAIITAPPIAQTFIQTLPPSAFQHHPSNYEYLQDMGSRSQTPQETSSWESQFNEQEAIIMSERPQPLQRSLSSKSRKSVHFDQSDTAESMNPGVPNTLAEALSHEATSTRGMGSSWEESLDDVEVVDEIDEQAFLAYNGGTSMGRVQDPRIGVGDLEGWGGMQNDWDGFQRGLSGKEKERYLFQRRNPHALSGERSATPGVLELEAAVQLDPTNSGAWYNLGLKQQENEREPQAILALAKSISLNPTMREAYLALAVSYTNEGDFMNANKSLERWIDLGEEGLDGHAVESQGENGGEWTSMQKRLVERLIGLARRNPERLDADVQVALGVLFNSTEEYDKAEDCFLAALSVRPDDWLLYNRLGATLANSGRSNQAIEYYHQALNLHPTFVRALFNLGISYINLSQYPQAAQYILEALRIQKADSTESYTTSQLEKEAGIEKGVMSSTLWNTLRNACLHMNRHDLVQLATQRNLEGFPMDVTTSA